MKATDNHDELKMLNQRAGQFEATVYAVSLNLSGKAEHCEREVGYCRPISFAFRLLAPSRFRGCQLSSNIQLPPPVVQNYSTSTPLLELD